MATGFSTPIIPGLPNDLALSILARLPRSLHSKARCVSRAWRDGMQPSTMDALRRALNISEAWVLLCEYLPLCDPTVGKLKLLLLDSLRLRCPVPPPPLPASNLSDWRNCCAVAAGSRVFLTGIRCFEPSSSIRRLDLEHTFFFDALRMQWSTPVSPRMSVDRLQFASATLDGYLYAAGGTVLDVNDGILCEASRSVERLDVRSGQVWEDVPDMHKGRAVPAGVVLQGRFCVIGGFCKSPSGEPVGQRSGEMWDPRSREWTLVPELCPAKVFGKCFTPHVAVVMGRLYALRPRSADVMYYEDATKLWIFLDCFPTEKPDRPNGYYGLKAVGEELWVTVNGASKFFVLATKPTITQTLSWRLLTFPYDHGPFIPKVAVSV